MKENIINLEGGDPLKIVEALANYIKDLNDKIKAQDDKIQELTKELEVLRNDPWSSRVTYENVVELIAQNEDSAVRDETRKVFEPLLKKEQVRQLRRDIRLKVKELESADGIEPRTLNNYGTVVQAGGINVGYANMVGK
jgi:hypothetical protein